MLTCLQAAVKVKDDHQETAQTQGKNQPHDLWFSHAESWGWGGVGGDPGSRTDSGWKQTVVLSTLSPTNGSIQRADLCRSRSGCTSLDAQAAVNKSRLETA